MKPKKAPEQVLWRVQVYTEGHPHISEMIVTADSKKAAAEKAIGHVKEANPDKGRSIEDSQERSSVLHVKKAGKNGAMVINRTPVAAYKAVGAALDKKKD